MDHPARQKTTQHYGNRNPLFNCPWCFALDETISAHGAAYGATYTLKVSDYVARCGKSLHSL
jgi:hypothetical protein